MLYLGIDLGTKKTGLAIANDITKTPAMLSTIYHSKGSMNWHQLDKIFVDYADIEIIVIGIPLTNNESKTMISKVRQFAKDLDNRYNKKVVLIDEYLSSNDAIRDLKDNKKFYGRKYSQLVDTKAATLILQTWLNENGKIN